MGTVESRTANRIFATLGVIFVAILVLLPVHAFISTWGGTAIGPLLVWKSWKEILILLALPFAVWACFLRPAIARQLWRSWLNRILLLYVVVTVVMAFASSASTSAIIAGFLLNLRFFSMFVLAQLVVACGAPWVAKMKAWLGVWLVATGAALSILAILQVTVIPKDFLAHFGYDKNATIAPYVLVDQNPNAVRAFATMRGPNTLGAYLLLPLALSLILWWQKKNRRWHAVSAGLMIVAIALTGSRSAWLGVLVMLLLLAWVLLPHQKLLRWLKWGTIPAIVLAGMVLWLATTVPTWRLAIFHSGGNSQTETLTEGSSDKHWQASLHGLQAVADNPLGEGVGTAGPASFYNAAGADIPEDYYIQIAQETGIFGIALFVAISVLLWKNLWLRRKELWPLALLGSFVGMTIINLFLHGWADDPTAMTWWGVAGLFVVPRIATKKQK